MRIISGDWKGHRLKAVRGLQTRPTSDKVKGAIFNILGDKAPDARILDLFAGTGNLSWEALSRGAAYAVLIEKSQEPWKTALENQKMLGAESKAKVIKMDVFNFLNQESTEKYDLIFADPPYRQGNAERVLEIMRSRSFLNPGGVVILETSSTEKLTDDLYPLEVMITKEYGDTKIWFLQEAEE